MDPLVAAQAEFDRMRVIEQDRQQRLHQQKMEWYAQDQYERAQMQQRQDNLNRMLAEGRARNQSARQQRQAQGQRQGIDASTVAFWAAIGWLIGRLIDWFEVRKTQQQQEEARRRQEYEAWDRQHGAAWRAWQAQQQHQQGGSTN